MENDIIIEAEGIKIQMREHRINWSDKDRRDRRQFFNGDTHVHVHIESESVFDDLKNRRTRPYTAWKKELLPIVARLIEADTGLTMGERPSWDQRLGCSCPCSPGFRTKLHDEKGNVRPYTVWVTI